MPFFARTIFGFVLKLVDAASLSGLLPTRSRPSRLCATLLATRDRAPGRTLQESDIELDQATSSHRHSGTFRSSSPSSQRPSSHESSYYRLGLSRAKRKLNDVSPSFGLIHRRAVSFFWKAFFYLGIENTLNGRRPRLVHGPRAGRAPRGAKRLWFNAMYGSNAG